MSGTKAPILVQPVRWLVRVLVLLAVILLGGRLLPVPDGGSGVSSPALALTSSDSSGWTVYHGDPSGSGADTSGVTFSPASPAWTSPALDGKIYGEPLEAGDRVFVATEDDTVYALSASTGAILWSNHVGSPVPNGLLPCGNIGPTVGITGTPVVDIARGELFAVADEVLNGAITHSLVGLSISTGKTMLNEVVDPAGSDPSALLQRTGLNLDGGNVVFGFGGNYGDCGRYHGWVMSVPETGGQALDYEVDAAAGENNGAVWMGGAAPEVDGSGNVWLSTGNGSASSSSDPYDHSDSVTELSPQMTLEQYFAPSTWYSDNAHDLDLGSTSPALLGSGAVLAVGKSQTAYLLNEKNLGGIGGQLASSPACGSDADGGHAISGSDLYVACRSGIQKIHTSFSPPAVSIDWTAASGSFGPPILAGGLLWSIRGGSLYGIDPTSGATVQKLSVNGEANPFATPSVGDGLLLAPSAYQVYAFSGSAGVPQPPVGSSTTTTTSTSGSGSQPPTTSCGTTDVALGRPTVASSLENGQQFPAQAATDGDLGTRWSSAWSDPQWLQVDLGATQVICQVTLDWEAAYATSFDIQVSNDGLSWATVYSTTTGSGGKQVISLSGSGRYLRMFGIKRATGYGDSLWEMQVFTATAPATTTTTVPATTTTTVPATTTTTTVPATTTTTMAPTTTTTEARQTNKIWFTSSSPTFADTGETGVGQSYKPAAKATSGLSVSFSIDRASTGGSCGISAAEVSFTGPGNCIIDANQAGNSFYLPGAEVQQKIVVHAIALTETSLSASSGKTTVGSNLTYTLTVANKGPGNARDLCVSLYIPDGVSIVSISGKPSLHEPSIVQWQPVSITSGSSATYSVTVHVLTNSSLTAGAWAYPGSQGSIDPDASKAYASVFTS